VVILPIGYPAIEAHDKIRKPLHEIKTEI
jgi:hypothetical protein